MCLVTARFVQQRWNKALMRRFLPAPIIKSVYSSEWTLWWDGDQLELVLQHHTTPEGAWFELDDVMAAERSSEFREAARRYRGGPFLVRVLIAADRADLLRTSLDQARRNASARKKRWRSLDFSLEKERWLAVA